MDWEKEIEIKIRKYLAEGGQFPKVILGSNMKKRFNMYRRTNPDVHCSIPFQTSDDDPEAFYITSINGK